jgi:isopentenyl-diphosphate delta-isomerase
MQEVILVDEHDNAIGTMEKMAAHRTGQLHRAFSVVLFNSNGEMLLQQRAASKYHSGGLWTNACCSHPAPSERIEDAAQRRLLYEMGIDVRTTFAFKFIYSATLDHGLIEHELDHVYTGTFDGTPVVNHTEVEAWKFIDLPSLRQDIKNAPEKYTAWFKLILDRI